MPNLRSTETVQPMMHTPTPRRSTRTKRATATARGQTGSRHQQSTMRKIAADGHAFLDGLSALGESRELSIAKTKLEEAVMWAVKAIAVETAGTRKATGGIRKARARKATGTRSGRPRLGGTRSPRGNGRLNQGPLA